jgi:hypothetical protein
LRILRMMRCSSCRVLSISMGMLRKVGKDLPLSAPDRASSTQGPVAEGDKKLDWGHKKE